MARRAMVGSILAGWAVEPGRYQPARCAAGGCWAVGHTDSGSGGSATATSAGTRCPVGVACCGKARVGTMAALRSELLSHGWLSGAGEDQDVFVDDQVGGLAAGAGLAGRGELPERRAGVQVAVA